MKKKEWKERKVSLGNAIIVAAVLTVLGVFVGANGGKWFASYAPFLGFSSSKTSSMDWSSLDEVYNQLNSTFNGEISIEAMLNGAKKGMTSALGDAYTKYMDAEVSSDFYNDLHGNVGSGIGVEMGLRDGYVRILRLLPDNPALKSGILVGDILYKVNGEEVYMLDSEEIAIRLRGDSGTEVSVTVVRDGKEKEFKMTREPINNVSTYVEYDGKTAIVTVVRFDTDTGRKIQEMAEGFEKKGINKVILDLRSNGGGYVSAAQDLLALWIDGQKILTQKSKHFGENAAYTTKNKAILENMKTIVLVNGSTASASEIVAGALQDYKKATIVGEKTYGKGVVQNLYNLSDGGTLKVTTASWYTPLDRSINGDGITPDKIVERSYDDINKMRDPQMDAAKAM